MTHALHHLHNLLLWTTITYVRQQTLTLDTQWKIYIQESILFWTYHVIQLIETSHTVITNSARSLVFRLVSNHTHDTVCIMSRYPCNHTTRIPRLGTLFRTRRSIPCSRVNLMKQETAGSTIKRRTGIIPSEARRASSVVVPIDFQWRSRVENKEIPGVPGGIFHNKCSNPCKY